jgi:hypothetical protein
MTGLSYLGMLQSFLIPALGPTQTSIQLVPEVPSLGAKHPGCEGEHSPPTSAKVKNTWSYTTTPPICLHGVVLSLKKVTRTTLPLPAVAGLIYQECCFNRMVLCLITRMWDFLNDMLPTKMDLRVGPHIHVTPHPSTFIPGAMSREQFIFLLCCNTSRQNSCCYNKHQSKHTDVECWVKLPSDGMCVT